jgi:NAD(P)-dependent dehydrogenase (short-subunit alcohol dehydrogenase family)
MNSDNNRVAPKVWLITGCSTGFGRALAEAVLKKVTTYRQLLVSQSNSKL